MNKILPSLTEDDECTFEPEDLPPLEKSPTHDGCETCLNLITEIDDLKSKYEDSENDQTLKLGKLETERDSYKSQSEQFKSESEHYKLETDKYREKVNTLSNEIQNIRSSETFREDSGSLHDFISHPQYRGPKEPTVDNEKATKPRLNLLQKKLKQPTRNLKDKRTRVIRQWKIITTNTILKEMRVPLIEAHELEFKELIGEGSSASVIKGHWQGTTVAIKVLKGLFLDFSVLRHFVREINIWNNLRHPLIVPLYGACVDPQSELCCIVMPFYKNGSLYSALQRQEFDMPWHLRIRIAYQIACGMRLLHSRKVLHRDLKSLNVLLTDGKTAQICDFGLAKAKAVAEQTHTPSARHASVGTSFWLDPDLITKKTDHTKETDVYSFAVTINEIASRKTPYYGMAMDKRSFNFSLNENSNLRPEIPKDAPELYAELVKECWRSNPSKRPLFPEIMDTLQQIGNGICIHECKKRVSRLFQNPEVQHELSEILDTAVYLGIDESDKLMYARNQLEKARVGTLLPSLERMSSVGSKPKLSGVPDPRNTPAKSNAAASRPPPIETLLKSDSSNTFDPDEQKNMLTDRIRRRTESFGELHDLIKKGVSLRKLSEADALPAKKQADGLEDQLSRVLSQKRSFLQFESVMDSVSPWDFG